MRNPTPQQQHWLFILDKWSHSGLNQAEFCRQITIKVKDFYRWKNRLENLETRSKDKCQSNSFIPGRMEFQELRDATSWSGSPTVSGIPPMAIQLPEITLLHYCKMSDTPTYKHVMQCLHSPVI